MQRYKAEGTIEINLLDTGYLVYVHGTVEDQQDAKTDGSYAFETKESLLEFIGNKLDRK